jgi:hypothetical protein
MGRNAATRILSHAIASALEKALAIFFSATAERPTPAQRDHSQKVLGRSEARF